MININIKATNMELTEAIRDYTDKKINSLEKFLHNESANVQVEVAKTTNHHKNGDVFHAEIDMRAGTRKVFARAEGSDLYASIDEAREMIMRELTHKKDKSRTLFKRGATSVKKMLKGISSRNPFTSKYK